jgi:predicted small metal-binding protein
MRMGAGLQGFCNVGPTPCPYTSEQEIDMARLIRCECGFVARGDTDDDVIAVIRGHMRDDHPALLETVDSDELRGWIELE